MNATTRKLKPGDYVLATKWGNGDPCDNFCVGYVAGFGEDRILIADDNGNLFRPNGFRRARKITSEQGAQLLALFPEIADKPGPSIWAHLRRIQRQAIK